MISYLVAGVSVNIAAAASVSNGTLYNAYATGVWRVPSVCSHM